MILIFHHILSEPIFTPIYSSHKIGIHTKQVRSKGIKEHQRSTHKGSLVISLKRISEKENGCEHAVVMTLLNEFLI